MLSLLSVLLAFLNATVVLAAPTPTVTYISSTSTRVTAITSCSCTSTYESNDRYTTVTLSASTSCKSKNIQPICKTTTSTIKSVAVSTKTLTTSTSSKSTTSSTTSKTSSSSTARSSTLSISSTPKPSTTSSSSSHSTAPTTSKSSTSTTTSISSTITSISKSSSVTSSPSSSPTPVKNTGKRGLSYNDPNLTAPFSLSGQSSKVSWSYNWYSYPYTIGQTQAGYNPALNFVPMLWSSASDLTSVWFSNIHASVAQYGTTAVVAFNEPDGCGGGGSCMSLNDSVSGYQQWMNPLAGTVRLGAPAVTNGGGTMGLTYLRSFLAQCTGCHIDFVPVHWYGDAGNSSGFEWYVQQAYAAGGNRPLWITEFGTTSGSAEETEGFLSSVSQWMDGQAMVERYAWFMDSAGNEINANGTGLSALGSLYNSG